jgi:hypothetical protein
MCVRRMLGMCETTVAAVVQDKKEEMHIAHKETGARTAPPPLAGGIAAAYRDAAPTAGARRV